MVQAITSNHQWILAQVKLCSVYL